MRRGSNWSTKVTLATPRRTKSYRKLSKDTLLSGGCEPAIAYSRMAFEGLMLNVVSGKFAHTQIYQLSGSQHRQGGHHGSGTASSLRQLSQSGLPLGSHPGGHSPQVNGLLPQDTMQDQERVLRQHQKRPQDHLQVLHPQDCLLLQLPSHPAPPGAL